VRLSKSQLLPPGIWHEQIIGARGSVGRARLCMRGRASRLSPRAFEERDSPERTLVRDQQPGGHAADLVGGEHDVAHNNAERARQDGDRCRRCVHNRRLLPQGVADSSDELLVCHPVRTDRVGDRVGEAIGGFPLASVLVAPFSVLRASSTAPIVFRSPQRDKSRAEEGRSCSCRNAGGILPTTSLGGIPEGTLREHLGRGRADVDTGRARAVAIARTRSTRLTAEREPRASPPLVRVRRRA
jgi:hypothetical protein